MSEQNTTNPQKAEALQRQLAAELFSNPKLTAYAVLDGAANPELLDHLYADGPRPEFECLYRGELEPDIAYTAPYLAKLEPNTPFSNWLISQCWGKQWGIFALSRADIRAVRQHFRKFNKVYHPETNNPVLFRYYDPRILRVFLPSCDEGQNAAFYGPMQAFFTESEEGESLSAYRRKDSINPAGASMGKMLVIRPEQMEVFRQAAAHHFEIEMLEHLGELSPPLLKAIGKEQMLKAIRFGITKAASHGFTWRGPVRFYLELMLLFGSHFDTDPQYPWAGEILVKQDLESQMQRAERLYEKTMDYRKKVAGPEDAYTLAALQSMAYFANQPLNLPTTQYMPALLQQIALIYPQKAAYIGREGLEALIRKGIGGAQQQQFNTIRGVTLAIMLMLALGHGCGYDPLYPWIYKTLMDGTVATPEERAKRLEKEALTRLEKVLFPIGDE